MKRYSDCFMEQSRCNTCSLSCYGRDCQNKPVNKLAYYRELKGLKQKELAELADVRTSYVGNIECGVRDLEGVSGGILLRLARALDVTIEELLC